MPAYFASCAPPFEPLLLAEVEAAGAPGAEQVTGGVRFRAEAPVAWRLCLWSRVGVRVAEELVRGTARDPDDLYRLAGTVPWDHTLGADRTFAVHASLTHSPMTHDRFAALRVKDAVVDRVRADTGRRPSVDPDDPDVPLKVVVHGEQVRIYRDLVGAPLHKRGWRPVQVKSPINEALAAGLLLLSGWDRRSPLLDPMCGSGTFPIEAAHLAGDRAPGLGRAFTFQRWRGRGGGFDPSVWDGILAEAEGRARAGSAHIPPLQGADHHPGALGIARASASRAGVAAHIRFVESAVAELVPEPVPAVVVVNPPWGRRLGDDESLAPTYDALGTLLKKRCPGARAWVLSGNAELTRHIRLKASARVPVKCGQVDCRFLSYEVR